MMLTPIQLTAIYDNGGKTIDRYTFVTDQLFGLEANIFVALGTDDIGGEAFSQWGCAITGRHLGKRVAFSDLPAIVQAHAARRLWATTNQ
jgi:hypothetical protein